MRRRLPSKRKTLSLRLVVGEYASSKSPLLQITWLLVFDLAMPEIIRWDTPVCNISFTTSWHIFLLHHPIYSEQQNLFGLHVELCCKAITSQYEYQHHRCYSRSNVLHLDRTRRVHDFDLRSQEVVAKNYPQRFCILAAESQLTVKMNISFMITQV